jgi:hypothetical protein
VASGANVSDPSWDPLLSPTPNHQDYLSTHATFGGAAAAVIKAWNKGDKINVTISSNVTVDNIGVITRRITNLTGAAVENGDSRIYGGVSLWNVMSFGTWLISYRFISHLRLSRAELLEKLSQRQLWSFSRRTGRRFRRKVSILGLLVQHKPAININTI